MAETIEAIEADRVPDAGEAAAVMPEEAAGSGPEADMVLPEPAEALPATPEAETAEDGETAEETPAREEQPGEAAEEASPAA